MDCKMSVEKESLKQDTGRMTQTEHDEQIAVHVTHPVHYITGEVEDFGRLVSKESYVNKPPIQRAMIND